MGSLASALHSQFKNSFLHALLVDSECVSLSLVRCHCSELGEFVAFDQRVLLSELVLVLLLVVKVALVVLRVPVLTTEHVLALAYKPEQTCSLLASKTCILVSLDWSLISRCLFLLLLGLEDSDGDHYWHTNINSFSNS